MIHWTQGLLDKVEVVFRSASGPLDGLKKVQRFAPEASYSSIRRALLRYGRPNIETLLKGSKVQSELESLRLYQPRIKPINANTPNLNIDESFERILIIPDCHHPFSDRRAWELMLKVGQTLKPDHIVILGDFADFFSISSFARNPNRVSQLTEEIDAANAALDQVDAIGAKSKIFCEGNHEARLTRYLEEKAPALFNVISVSKLFGLERRGWQFVPYRQHAQLGKLFLTHDVGASGATAHIKAGAAFEHSIVQGHVHGLHVSFFGNALGQRHVTCSAGWLGDREKCDYINAIKSLRDWQLGFVWCGIERDTGIVHLSPIPIIEYRCIVEGRLFRCATVIK